MPTLADVAARAGVSVSAVSRVLANHPAARVSDETRQRIQRAARDLNYRPNFAGRALKSARTDVIGLVMPDLTNALFTEMLDGAEEEARQHGYMLLLGRAEYQRPNADVIRRLIGEGRVDGVMVQLGDAVRPAALAGLFEAGSPVVLVNARDESHEGSVVLDDQAGGRIATEHLLELGHQRIGMITGLPATFTAKHRLAGFRSAMKAAGIKVEPALISRQGYLPNQGRVALRQLVELPVPPTAIVVANLNAAMGVLAEARQMGFHIPEDFSVVSIHDSWNAENTWPPLTTVKMPFHELGRLAVRTLVHRLQTGENCDVMVSSPFPELIVRQSTAPLP